MEQEKKPLDVKALIEIYKKMIKKPINTREELGF